MGCHFPTELEISETYEDPYIQDELYQLSTMAQTVLDMLENEDETLTPPTAYFQSKPMISDRSDQRDNRSQTTAEKIATARRKNNGEYGYNTVNTTKPYPGKNRTNHREWITVSRRSTKKERPRLTHFKVDETTVKRVSTQGETTSSSARCPSQNKFEILGDHPLKEECDKDAEKPGGEAKGVAE